MGKTLKLFGIGSAITAISLIVLFSGVLDSVTSMIIIFPGAIGVFLMILGAHYGLRRFDRYMDRD